LTSAGGSGERGSIASSAAALRAAFHAEPWGRIAAGLELTTSIGVVSAPDADDLDGLERDADDRLHAAKRAGRDRAVAGS
jgi:GGDEF domain-containing protein